MSADPTVAGHPDDDALPVGVVGCGRMGRFHARTYAAMPSVRLIGVCDANPETASAVAAEFRTHSLSLAEIAERAAAVTVAVPTAFHVETALPLLKRRIACLIEKPLADTAADARRLAEAARDADVVLQVGHIERFNPAVRAMRRHARDVRFLEVVRISPLTFRSLDVGVVLDMMIHDLDIVLSLAGSPASDVQATGVSVIGDAEDVANARVTFANGCVANLTASRLATKTERKLRVFSPTLYVSLDYQQKQGVMIRRGENLEALRSTLTDLREGRVKDLSQVDYAELVDVEPLAIEEAEPLRLQLESFVNAVRGRSPVEVTADDGVAAVDLAERIVAAIGRHVIR